MHEIEAELHRDSDTDARAEALFADMRDGIYRRTGRMFVGLMLFQWAAGVAATLLISPTIWGGASSETYPHLWMAILLGASIISVPTTLVFLRPTSAITRHMVAIAQMLICALIIHLTGGRIETHFQYFGALAFLAFYRDWRILISASIVAAVDHWLSGLYFPHAMYGVAVVEWWRWLEHTGWILFEDVFLIVLILQRIKEMRGIVERQARLETVNARIEREVALRTGELMTAQKAATAASVAKSEFLSSMSHEIRTPMNAILGMTELLEETPLNGDQAKYLSVMKNNGEALLILINQILDLARVESGRMALERANFDLEVLIDKTLEMLAYRAHEKGLELAAHIKPGTPLHLVGDPLRLRQILINLIGNSIKFTSSGQVLLSVECEPDSALPSTFHFAVSDTGIGIAREKLELLFTNFSQADSSTTRKYGGSGLGLAIVKNLAALFDGRVWVESELGVGSVFHFTARLELQSESAVDTAPPAPLMLRGSRVLVVDDNAVNRLILREILSARGAEVVEAGDGPGGLELLEQARREGKPFKLVMLDGRMPGMDGFEVADKIRDAAHHELTVMMLSSDDLPIRLAQARALGLDAYLVKPIRRADLLETLALAMRPAGAMARTAPSPLPTPESITSTPLAPLHILVADDSADNRMLVRAYLKDPRFTLDEAENGQLALSKMQERKYDLVLMDIQMPVMDGFEAIRVWRQREKSDGRERTWIVTLSASALENDVRRSLEAGADLHLSKPISKRKLLATVMNIPQLSSASPPPKADAA
ncbi:MAG TPA: response regulator [Candidatus Acidoferrales bacterium]|nr:response regulator [Candidatus Acidoferrales bacterium]